MTGTCRTCLALSPSDEALVETVARAYVDNIFWEGCYDDPEELELDAKRAWLNAARAAVTAAVQHAEERAR